MHRVPCRAFCLDLCILLVIWCFLLEPVTPHRVVLHSAVSMPRGVLGALWVVCLLYNASGSCNWCLGVCGHCVVVLGLISVIVCLLMANWMSVEIAVVAKWLFFFLFAVRILAVHDTALASFWG
jgi:hypothetical protein